jgi:superfamily II DNA or RNA helicase
MKFRYDKVKEELVVTDATRIEYHQLQIWLSRHVKGYRFMPAFKMGIWNGQQSYFKDGRINLGLWKECVKASNEIGVKFQIENKEDFPLNRDITYDDVKEFCGKFFGKHKVKNKKGEWIQFMPYEHQIESAFKILKNRYCMAEVATSGGKSLIISIVIFYTLKHMNPDAKFLMIVPSITLVTQFYDNILEYNYSEKTLSEYRSDKLESILTGNNSNDSLPCSLRIEEVMSDKPRKHSGVKDANVYIGTYQSLEKWPKEFFQQFHTVACDEAHGAKAKTTLDILKKTIGHAHSRFGVSGTFPPDDSCEILTIQSVLGPKIAEVSASQLKAKGIITPMKVKALIMNHADPAFEKQMEEIKRGGLGKEVLNFEKKYIHESEKRKEIISKIVHRCDKNTLILFHSIEHGQALLNYLSKACPEKEFYYIDGSITNKNRESIKKKMEETDGRVKVLIASYGTLSTGVSIKAIFNVIFADSFKSEQIIIQSIGRALRLHKDKATAMIFDLVDVFTDVNPSNILYRHFQERKKFYFNREYPYSVKKIILN